MRDRFLGRLYRLMDSPLGAVLGAMVYGLWAFYVNRHAGWPHAALIGVAHWMMSVVITISCVSLMRALFWLPNTALGGALLAVAGSLSATYTLLVSVHLYLGTPHILLTLAPGLAPTVGFAVVYASLIHRQHRDCQPLPGQRRRRPQAAAVATPGAPHARA